MVLLGTVQCAYMARSILPRARIKWFRIQQDVATQSVGMRYALAAIFQRLLR